MPELPEPPIAPDVDLRAFDRMPLDVQKLMNSDTWTMADGWQSRALINLWSRAWHQVPAGSLPDSDAILAKWADVPDWEHVRDVAIRGFHKCSDGRLYHPVLCELAINAESQRKQKSRAGKRGAKSRWGHKKQLSSGRHDSANGDAIAASKQRHGDANATAMRFDGIEGRGREENIEPPCSPPIDDLTFERFWTAYPSRGQSSNPKSPAREKFKRLVSKGEDPETIIAGAERYAERMADEQNRSLVAQATTFLNQRRWEDENANGAATPPVQQGHRVREELPPDLQALRERALAPDLPDRPAAHAQAAMPSDDGYEQPPPIPDDLRRDSSEPPDEDPFAPGNNLEPTDG